ncbi:hypothetical protein [uncultured Ilumatobacter sp.]|uniref:hypothetical protein n=1 Tax=uncultured Ilumatobacter sp. TaxID=879968 RepID=UPI00374E84C5
MPRRIDIELTSASSDGSWTWRAAGALKPKGTVDGSILHEGASIGDVVKVEAEQMLDGMEILSVVKSRDKNESRGLMELLPDDKPFEAVIETKAKRGRGERSGGNDREGRGRGRGRDGDDRGGRPARDGDKRGPARDGDKRSPARDGDKRERSDRPKKPHFEAPPEVPQRPKPKRLRPGKARTQEVLASVPEEQRPIAELALQGMGAVRTRVKEENAKLKADAKPEMPESSVTKMAEDMLPKLRVADWLDRAEAAQRQMQHLDLRDLRSVVAASADPMVARDESTRAIADELKASLVTKQSEEMAHWLEDVDAALTVGRVIRALRLSSQPPKAGVMFPPQLAKRLGEAATNSLLPDDSGDRWSAVLEAAAFSPVRALVTPTVAPTTIDDELKKTTLRLGPLLPQIAALLGIEIPASTKRPKPLRPTSRKEQKKVRDDKRESGSDKRESGSGERGSRDGAARDGAGRGRDGAREGGGRDDRGGRGRDDRGGRGKPSGPRDRPKGMRDVAEVMAAKRAAEAAEAAAVEAAAEAAAAAAAAEAEATAAVEAPAESASTVAPSTDEATEVTEVTNTDASEPDASTDEATSTPAEPEAAPEATDATDATDGDATDNS